ncbi:MAG: V-type ATP synthase subunit E [Acidimicrobiia bacterium]|nr:V-type ATP synthase subunit E [Acidimicrobiia bacterium]
MPLDDILTAIRSEADAEIREIRASCAAEVAALAAEADEQALEAERAAAASRDLAADREVARIVNRAALEATRKMMSAVEIAYQEALDALRVRLGAVRDTAEYPDILARLLDEVLDVLPDATGVLVDPADTELVGSLLVERDRRGLAVETASTCLGGVELVTDDGRAVRNTFESRLQRADGRLRRLVAQHIPDRDST